MGGCASKPKALGSGTEPVPREAPDTPKKAEGETLPQENNNGGETKKEEPLVDLSEPAEEAPKSEGPSSETAKPTAEKVEAANETKEPIKEEEKKEVAVVAEKPLVGAAAPSSEDKSDEPLVTV
ncbi:hypothetical protein F0562_026807 [Nyssa sinensis]|uniref:Uncharacterized protein n=1 Tax=Nyssa sinensis TaxID=561372 RepID=A0A5J5BAB4_9ASTE|nr:hypothetical protein F0562_026807 [Nyssa sinensis]